jgi:hypothetical protein
LIIISTAIPNATHERCFCRHVLPDRLYKRAGHGAPKATALPTVFRCRRCAAKGSPKSGVVIGTSSVKAFARYSETPNNSLGQPFPRVNISAIVASMIGRLPVVTNQEPLYGDGWVVKCSSVCTGSVASASLFNVSRAAPYRALSSDH